MPGIISPMDDDLGHPKNVQRKLEKQTGEQEIIDGLTRGDEASFILLVEKYHHSMLRKHPLFDVG